MQLKKDTNACSFELNSNNGREPVFYNFAFLLLSNETNINVALFVIGSVLLGARMLSLKNTENWMRIGCLFSIKC